MPKVALTYPVICFNKIEIDMTDDEFDELKGKPLEDQAEFIYQQNKLQDIPDHIDVTDIQHALDVDYATIRRVH